MKLRFLRALHLLTILGVLYAIGSAAIAAWLVSKYVTAGFLPTWGNLLHGGLGYFVGIAGFLSLALFLIASRGSTAGRAADNDTADRIGMNMNGDFMRNDRDASGNHFGM